MNVWVAELVDEESRTHVIGVFSSKSLADTAARDQWYSHERSDLIVGFNLKQWKVDA